MSKYYTYKPTTQGWEPTGTSNRSLFELKTDAGAIRRARRLYGDTAMVFKYTDFYDDKTFRRVA